MAVQTNLIYFGTVVFIIASQNLNSYLTEQRCYKKTKQDLCGSTIFIFKRHVNDTVHMPIYSRNDRKVDI